MKMDALFYIQIFQCLIKTKKNKTLASVDLASNEVTVKIMSFTSSNRSVNKKSTKT